ncbi:protein serine/threonine phosphatase 2C [Daldinia decipiens]|uniref:protein serine/threonine phosphatase 2C n=1 Tax=Daldinia decipiens TaxID=326647 RepID=UPI0020C521FD|nr:protein serine/threonine phosphatase 2C [Daldinia decipiens]KAI1656291.1 protein serine/threonine phosphatase 2C [Daldinia decipiens]
MGLSRGRPKRWSLNDTYGFIATFFDTQTRTYARQAVVRCTAAQQPSSSVPAPQSADATSSRVESRALKTAPHHNVRRSFHTYFVTHLPSSSLHPDSRAPAGPHHKLPRSAAAPHTAVSGAAPVSPPHLPSNRDLTVVRIPLRSAKHHFGVANSRGSRPYNEDTNQAGTIDIPAFAKRAPISLVRSTMNKMGEGTSADSPYGDPQIFYFGVFDGHGGTQCSDFLRDELHGYIEEAAEEFELQSSLRTARKGHRPDSESLSAPAPILSDSEAGGQKRLDWLDIKGSEAVSTKVDIPEIDERGAIREVENPDAIEGVQPVPDRASGSKALQLQSELVKEYKNTVGGYFRRFHPPYFQLKRDPDSPEPPVSVESVLTYAFLRADLDFIAAQARKPDPDDPYVADTALNFDEVLGKPHHMPPSGQGIGGRTRFKGGSTASVTLISTPTPAPFWHPAASSTLLVGHVGDTRVLLCETATGLSRPLTSDHHPCSPSESHRLRRFAASFVTDSFGEERIQGLANSRAFGDMASKRLGVSAEPEITRTELGPAQYSFIVLMSDGVSGTLSDQEIVDVVKEAKTPEQGARDVVAYATEVSRDGDNATCLVVRLGGWERRSEGGLGSLGTKEIRDFRRNEAMDPRRGIR